MASMIQVEAARIPDRDRLLQTLLSHGIDARPEGEVSIEVPCGEASGEDLSTALLHEVEGVVFDLGAPFVPVKHEGVIYLRPPTN
jgi:hypothetical protein